MLILGEQHQFTEQELKTLHKKFKTIDFIKYKNMNIQEVINQISSITSNKHKIVLVLNTKAIVPDELLKYLTKLEKKGINYIGIQRFMEKYLYKCYIPSKLRDISFLENIQPFSRFQYIQKRTIDYGSSILLLLLTFPIMLYAVYRIKKESPGPIFFKQSRIGKQGEPFTCIKFRSMYANSEHNPYTQKNDKRIFPWGATMRKLRIDELPQIFNVLKGEMHFIGPRAEWDILVDNYEQKIPYYHERHIIRPGITGWAQVNYPYGENAFDAKQKLMYDLYYIKHWSLGIELKTIWKTFMVVLGKKGI
ncbi:MAG: UDP-glucose lipid carrier transferase [uncultured Sulfurovum sp.]|uniref:UDP-glucose lipid carrier transferase n=1 Tax=uncultured Sulfurovum sp. TaxID=269237 RepID=A0A6S6TCD3_9BACT|nr:MAG: UDP-glucose lipid carrier transferase [uncultured Sulfurovum sp.]